MTYFIALLAGLAGAAIGWGVGSFATPFVAPWLSLGDIPFTSQTFAGIGVSEIGAGIGLVIGIIAALRLYGGYRTAGGIFGRGILVAAVASGGIFAVAEAGGALLDTMGLNPLPPVVEFEIRFPPGATVPATRDEILVELHTDRNQVITKLTDIERIGDRLVLRGSAPLVFRTTQRTIVMSLPGAPARVFRLRLAARPSATPEYGPWQQVDFLEEAQRMRRSDVTADYAIRYRVN